MENASYQASSIHDVRASPASSSPHSRDSVISKIEDLIDRIITGIVEDDPRLSITLCPRRTGGDQSQEDVLHSSSRSSNGRDRELCFPGGNQREGWAFAAVIRILEMIHEALVKGYITTKRDIYYKDPKLFVKQSVVDQYVDDIACTLGVPRHCLNVVAAAKGLVVGPVKILRMNGSYLDCSLDEEGTLVPNAREIRALDMSEVRWILVIEKEATFRSLAASGFWKRTLVGKGLLVTAKGYPDISTRYFLRLLATHPSQPDTLRPPVYALVDFDPHGLSIATTYKYGSRALAHENAHLTVPALRWLGVRSATVAAVAAAAASGGDSGGGGVGGGIGSVGGAGGVGGDRALLPMSLRDRRKARAMLARKAVFRDGGEEPAWRRELQVMLLLNVKAEIQSLSELGGGVEAWLHAELSGAMMPRALSG